jgi:hypothetical protein
MPNWLTEFSNECAFKEEPRTTSHLEKTPPVPSIAASAPSSTAEGPSESGLPGLDAALEKITELLQAKVPRDQSRFRGVGRRLSTGWQILKFKTVGTRTCLNGCKHDSNQFSILSNGAVLVYRCLSPGCDTRPKPLLGIHFWPECLPLRADGGLLRECERYVVPFEPPEANDVKPKKQKEDDRTEKAKLDLNDLTLNIMNHYFAVVRSTKAIYLETIYSRGANGQLLPEETITRSGRDFLEVCKNFQLQSLPGMCKEVARFWESSSKRREYDKLVFEANPSKMYSRHFNMFCGLKFQPIDRKLTESELVECEDHMPKLMWHFRNIVCDGSSEGFDYTIRWIAHAVQKPWKKIGVALVFRGGQGSGKSSLWDFVGLEILGERYYLYCNQIETVIGKFNSLGANRLLIVFDEAGNWGGAFKMNNRMKSQITQERTCLEHKGRDPIRVQDKSNVVITTNNFWPVKREADDRRYACQQCSNAKMGDKPYFDALVDELEKPETPYHFHRYLSSIDISHWDPQKMPLTAWGEGLKDNSIPPHVSMMQALLENGCFHPSLETWVASTDIKRTFDAFLLQLDIKEERHTDVNILIRSLNSIFTMRPQARSIQGVRTHKGWWFSPQGAICEALRKGKLLSSTVEWVDTWQRPEFTEDEEGPYMTDPKAFDKLEGDPQELRRSAAAQKCSFCSNHHEWVVRRDEEGHIVTRESKKDKPS